MFLPAVRPLLALAAEMERDRNYVIMPASRDEAEEDADPLDLETSERTLQGPNEYLESQAEFAHLLSEGRAVQAGEPGRPATPDDEEYLGLPGLLDPEQMALLLTRRDAALRRKVTEVRNTPIEVAETSAGQNGWRAAAALRREVNQLVAQVAARTGSPHAKVHVQVRTAVPGPVSAAAGVELLERRRDYLLGMI